MTEDTALVEISGPADLATGGGSSPALFLKEASSIVGLRDWALIGIMIYTFPRVGAVLQMNVGDYFSQGRRGWVRLHEKGGKEHEARCVSKLEAYLDQYLTASGIQDDKDGPLFAPQGALPASGIA